MLEATQGKRQTDTCSFPGKAGLGWIRQQKGEDPTDREGQRQPPKGWCGPLAGCLCTSSYRLILGVQHCAPHCPRRTWWSSSFHPSATEAGTSLQRRLWSLESHSSTLPLTVHGTSHTFSITNSSLHAPGWEPLCEYVGEFSTGGHFVHHFSLRIKLYQQRYQFLLT